MKRFDKVWIGLIAGLVLPVLGFFIGYFIKFYPRPVGTYYQLLLSPSTEQTEIFTFCMLPNLFIFYFLFFQWKLDYASKGLVTISLIYVTILAYIKFV